VRFSETRIQHQQGFDLVKDRDAGGLVGIFFELLHVWPCKNERSNPFFGALLSVSVASGRYDLDHDRDLGGFQSINGSAYSSFTLQSLTIATGSYGVWISTKFASWTTEHERWFSTRPKCLGLSPRRPSQGLTEFPLCLTDLVRENTDLSSAWMCVQHGSERT
jgi:hypothetical protein